jgi:dipeptidyl aminopeptidase/acylaminoacyl peptidase
MEFSRARAACSTCASLITFGLLGSASLAAAEVPPAEAFGAIPTISEVELSPNGRMIAWLETTAQGAQAVTFDLDAHVNKHPFPTTKDVPIRSLSWADNETLLVTVSTYATYGETNTAHHYTVRRTFAADVNTGKVQMLLMNGGERAFVTGATLLAWRTPKPKTVIMSSLDFSEVHARQQTGSHLTVGRKDEGWVDQVFEVDTRTGKGKVIATGTAFTDDWVVDKSGKPVARSEWNPQSELFTILVRNGSGWKEVLREEHLGTRVLFGLNSDETGLIISAKTSAGRRSLWLLPLDGSPGRALLEDETHDISNVAYDRITRAPVGAYIGGEVHWLDKDAEDRFQRVARAFKDKRVTVYGRSEDGMRILAEVDTPSTPPIYYFVDFAKGTADTVGEAYPALVNAKLGELRQIEYKARDGVTVPAFLTLPPDSSGKNLPLVVLPHGGPEARDDYAFDWWAQFLAVRGYAVLQPQFRGSTGLGEAWRQAGYRQWGGLMQDDVTDGVTAMIEQGVADAKRVAIVGGSYGGYAALAGAAFTPDLYRCAVSVNGVSSLPAMLGYYREHSGTESDALAYWRDHIGAATDAQVIARSPSRSAATFKAPVLLMHAVNDTVVPYEQSKTMARELENEHKAVTFVSLAGEDHWLSQTATRVQMLKELEKFLAEHLRADH